MVNERKGERVRLGRESKEWTTAYKEDVDIDRYIEIDREREREAEIKMEMQIEIS